MSNHLQQAHHYAQQGHLHLALDYYTQAICAGGHCGEAYYYRGNTLADWGYYPEALKDYDQAVQDLPAPLQVQLYLRRGQLQLQQAQLYQGEHSALPRRLNQPFLDLAIQDFTHVIEQDPFSDACIEAYFYRGFAHYKQHQYQQALVDLSQAIAIHFESTTDFLWAAQAHYLCGAIEYQLEHYELALQEITQALLIHHDPSSQSRLSPDALQSAYTLQEKIERLLNTPFARMSDRRWQL